jgi:ABC-2 type transport system ATP-binding protein/lipopolysaccharide transport system ATP-binding protein
LLRILSGIFEPTAGTISIRGTAMPLFNLTEGMDPDATGMELIRVRGYLLGLTPVEIAGITDDVIQFCELGEFINLPIRTYSAGMLVRLAFAITTAVTSDILLMDEVIGAGDAAFIERAELRMRSFVERAGILVVASHSPEIIRKWCNKALLLEHGRMVMLDNVESVLNCYQSLVECRRE